MVKIGDVETFREIDADKAQALKVLEEAAEVFGAWQVLEEPDYSDDGDVSAFVDDILNECADVIMATCNMISALDVDDFTPYMEACRKRNEERGRM